MMPAPTRSGFNPWKVLALLMLVAGTCGAVTLLASVWLVPPYLVVMALILFPTGGTRPNPPNSTQPAGSTHSLRDQADPVDEDGTRSAAGENSVASSASDGPADPGDTSMATDPAGPSIATARPKRSRSRPRKVKPTTEVVEPAPATWMEVGPGKFVRVESPAADAMAASPHFDGGPAPQLDLDPIGTTPPASTSAGAGADGSDHPELTAESIVIEPIITLPGLIFEPADEFDAPDHAPGVAAAPAIVALESPTDPVPAALGDQTRVEESRLIDPTADGTTPQVEADAGLDLTPGPIPQPPAAESAPDPMPDVWLCDAPDLDVASLESSGPGDGTMGLDQEPVMPDLAMTSDPVDVALDREIEAPATADPVVIDVPIARELPAQPVIRSQRGGLSRPSRRLTLRGSTGRAGPLPRRPTSSRLGQRREVRRPHPIARTARPRSPPVVGAS